MEQFYFVAIGLALKFQFIQHNYKPKPQNSAKLHAFFISMRLASVDLTNEMVFVSCLPLNNVSTKVSYLRRYP